MEEELYIYSYETLKVLAKQVGKPVTDLIALSRNNDPFYVGTEKDRNDGQWFQDQWQLLGYSQGVHIRRMHYALVSQSTQVKMPNGMAYENSLKCWKYLNDAAKSARYLEMVDPGEFVDRRNEAPIDRIDYETTLDSLISVDWFCRMDPITLDFPDIPAFSLDRFTSPQRYHLELWCEKSGVNDVLEPLARQYKATFLFGKGELSITAALQAIRRFQRTGKPVRIFYISDFDPAGVGMPISMARKLEYFVRNMHLDLDIKLFPVVLTAEQVEYYKQQTPPIRPVPMKEKELRAGKFMERYGKGDGADLAVELDALETLYPGELARILRRELDRYYDHTLFQRVQDAKEEKRDELEGYVEDLRAEYADQIEEIESEQEEMQRIFDEQLEGRIESHADKLYDVSHAIHERLEELLPEIEYCDIPEADYAEERTDALYDSSRDYLAQNEVYHAHRNNEHSECDEEDETA